MSTQSVLVRDPTTELAIEKTPNTTSAGSADAGKLVALNGAGVLDSTLLPPGIGAASISLPATETIASGAMVNIWSSSGTTSIRNASAADATKPVSGFVLAGVASGSNATVNFIGQIVTGVSGLTPGAPVYLSASTPGGVTATAPSGAGNLVCVLSQAAISATEFVLEKVSSIIHG